MEKTLQRNQIWDFFKGIFAIGVVFVHFPFPGVVGKILASVGVVGVIFFFLISGYQSYSPDGSRADKLLGRFKRNLKLTGIALLCYIVFTVIQQLIHGMFGKWIKIFLNPITYVKMILLGDFSMFNADALWFMPALLYCYLIVYIMEKKRLNKYFYAALPLLLLLRIGMETYTNSFSLVSWLDWHFSGNFLVGGLPVMLLGNYLHSKADPIKKLNGKAVIAAACLSALLVFLFVNVKVFSVDISQPFKIAAALFVFMGCLIYSESAGIGFINTLGRKYTLYIYLYHYLVGTIISEVFIALALLAFCKDYILPVCTVLASFAVSAAIVGILGRCKRQCSNDGVK